MIFLQLIPALISTICLSSFCCDSFSIGLSIESKPTTRMRGIGGSTTLQNMSIDSNDGDESDDESLKAAAQSFLEGNRRDPSAQEISIMDDMITKLSDAKPYELPSAVSKAIRIVSSPKFFMRIAARADMTTDPIEKEKLSALATNLVATLEAVVSTTEDRLDERATNVQDIVKAAAEPNGEFLVPLTPERIAAMRTSLQSIDSTSLDEGFLSTVDAWMKKSLDDGLDGMVAILQKVLQIYAGYAIKNARVKLQADVGASVSGQNQAKVDEVLAEQGSSEPTSSVLLMERLMETDTDMWGFELKKMFETGEVTPLSIKGEVQRTMEAVVLGLDNGSMAQRVQAEYLRELVTRIDNLATDEISS